MYLNDRTKAGPAIYYCPAKPCEETDKLLQDAQQVNSFCWHYCSIDSSCKTFYWSRDYGKECLLFNVTRILGDFITILLITLSWYAAIGHVLKFMG